MPAAAQNVPTEEVTLDLAARRTLSYQTKRALARGREAMKAQDFARAHKEYRIAVDSLRGRKGVEKVRSEAVRGFAESGVKLARQRFAQGRFQEAERIAREILDARYDPKYRPAIELLAKLRLNAEKSRAPVASNKKSTSNDREWLRTIRSPHSEAARPEYWEPHLGQQAARERPESPTHRKARADVERAAQRAQADVKKTARQAQADLERTAQQMQERNERIRQQDDERLRKMRAEREAANERARQRNAELLAAQRSAQERTAPQSSGSQYSAPLYNAPRSSGSSQYSAPHYYAPRSSGSQYSAPRSRSAGESESRAADELFLRQRAARQRQEEAEDGFLSEEIEQPAVKWPIVKVYFGTDRLPNGSRGPSKYFGIDWNKEGEPLITGVVSVSIPPAHKEGQIERPGWIFDRREDVKKHFVLTELRVAKGDDFYAELRDDFGQRSAEDRSAFVYIHGYNVTFDDAAYATAQIAYDLDFKGVPMMFSWPSQGDVLAYDGDQETVDFSWPNLQAFLERVARESGAQRIHVMAHSMGNRLLTRALQELVRQPDIQPLFENVIMASPDVNARVFTGIWPKIKVAAKRFTLYASSDDNALITSRKAKGNSNFTRLGEGGPNIVVISGLDTIDASGIDTSLLGHSYEASCKPVRDDLGLLIGKGLAPPERHLPPYHTNQGLAYWRFPPTQQKE